MGYGKNGRRMKTVMCEPLDATLLLKARNPDVDIDNTLELSQHDKQQFTGNVDDSMGFIVTDLEIVDYIDKSNTSIESCMDYGQDFQKSYSKVGDNSLECEKESAANQSLIGLDSVQNTRSKISRCRTESSTSGIELCDVDHNIGHSDAQKSSSNLRNSLINVSHELSHCSFTDDIDLSNCKQSDDWLSNVPNLNKDTKFTHECNMDDVIVHEKLCQKPFLHQQSVVSDSFYTIGNHSVCKTHISCESNASQTVTSRPANDVLELTLTQSLPIEVTSDCNKISEVLQNVPLVYIPATKQLGLVDSERCLGNDFITAGSNIEYDIRTPKYTDYNEYSTDSEDIERTNVIFLQNTEKTDPASVSSLSSNVTKLYSNVNELSSNPTELSSNVTNSSNKVTDFSRDPPNASNNVTDFSRNVPRTSTHVTDSYNVTDSSSNVTDSSNNVTDFSRNVPRTSTHVTESYNVTNASSNVTDLSRNVPWASANVTDSSYNVTDSSYNVTGLSRNVPLASSNVTDSSYNVTDSSECVLHRRGTDHIPAPTDTANFISVNLQSRNSFEPCRFPEPCEQFTGAKPKRRGFGNFLSVRSVQIDCGKMTPVIIAVCDRPDRMVDLNANHPNLFSKKTKDANKSNIESEPGWKLFGRVPPIYVAHKETDSLSDGGCDNHTFKSNQVGATPVSHDVKTLPVRKSNVEVSSTTGLILENRPTNLPSKTPEESLRHRQQYEAMVEAARKKEQRDLKMMKKKRSQQLKQEEKLVSLARFWLNDVLPNWDVMHSAKRTLDLWWYGLPPNVRGKVWQLAIGNDLNLTHDLYDICSSRATDRIKNMSENSEPLGSSETSSEPSSSKEASVELIKLDVSRTFPQLCIFQKGGPYHDLLHSLLGAYACYRPDVGYVQGMSFIAAVLLLNMDVAAAFVCFSNILNRPCQVAFFRLDEEVMKSYFLTFKEFFRENLPELFDYFTRLHLEPEVYLFECCMAVYGVHIRCRMFTLYSKSLPLDVACRVWDIFCRDGEEFLFRTALGILRLYQEILLSLDFIHLAQFLTRLPDTICADDLFRSISAIKMAIDKKRFAQVLATFRDPNKDII